MIHIQKFVVVVGGGGGSCNFPFEEQQYLFHDPT